MKLLTGCTFNGLAGLAAALVVLPFSVALAAQEPKSQNVDEWVKAFNAQQQQLAEQEKRLKDQKRQLSEQERQLKSQKSQFQKLRTQMVAITGRAIDAYPADDKASKLAQAEPAAGQPGEPEEVGTDRKPVEREKPPEIAAELEEGGVLLNKGRLVITPSTEYTRSSATRVAIEGFSIIPALNIGAFEISQVNRDILTAAVGARLGVTNRFEIDAKVPYVYRSDSTRSRPFGIGGASEIVTDASGDGIGDIELGAHYQINDGKNGWPFFIGNVRFKTITGEGPFEVPVDPDTGLQTELPTGSGFYALQPSVTIIYPSDPAVFYSNIGYVHNFARSFDRVGEISPGDSVSGSFGMSVSLNDKSSFSLGYSHSTVFKTEQNGRILPNTTLLQVGSVDMGYSYTLTPAIGVNVNVSAGITEDAPDSRITFRVPIAYDLF